MEARLQAERDMAEFYTQQGKTLIRVSDKQLRIFFALLQEIELITPNTIQQ